MGDRDGEDLGTRPALANRFTRPHFNRKSRAWWCLPVNPETVGSLKSRRITVHARTQQKTRPYLQKKPSKCEALSSNLGTAKKREFGK
jgi:hypothetical protein